MTTVSLLFLPYVQFLILWTAAAAFSRGTGLGASSSSDNAFVSLSRFRADCPADLTAIRHFDPALVPDDEAAREPTWVAVYRSANNLPSVFVRDDFLDAMKASTTAPAGDADTLVSPSAAEAASGVISNGNGANDNGQKPVAVARLFKGDDDVYILDSMRCTLKKENTDAECDGGSEHAEAIGVCIDELVLAYLRRYLDDDDGAAENDMTFHRGIHFRGTLVAGQLLDSRGFREATELSPDMHSHESDFDGALAKYAARSMSKEVAKNSGARDRALNIVSYLVKVDKVEDQRSAEKKGREDNGDEEEEIDPWASIKKFI